ncbi:MAG: hypothetical protein JJU02_15585 [Cryomorphaceae bacterium]|nr:hypothetical protein [Cryomorphaceae bacterium]
MRKILCLCVVVFSCQSNMNEGPCPILGKWFFVDSDGTYGEVFFNDSLFVSIDEQSFYPSWYKYTIIEDSLCVFDFEDNKLLYKMKILIIDSTEFELISPSGYTFKNRKLKSENDWSSLSNDSIYEEFKVRQSEFSKM